MQVTQFIELILFHNICRNEWNYQNLKAQKRQETAENNCQIWYLNQRTEYYRCRVKFLCWVQNTKIYLTHQGNAMKEVKYYLNTDLNFKIYSLSVVIIIKTKNNHNAPYQCNFN